MGMTLERWDDRVQYKVVVSREQAYSIWPADRENPAGWKSVGKVGSKTACLTYIEEVWTDLRSLTLRDKMDKLEDAAKTITLDAGGR
jgi:MbtH protein